MPVPAFLLAALLMAADPSEAPVATAPSEAEPLPAAAPTDDYQLAAWCYGALAEYLDVYQKVKPDLIAIDKQYGSSVPHEKEPYASDMAAARVELKLIGNAVAAAEQASPSPIAPQGVAALNRGRAVWGPAEEKTHRELARAWLSWALPDRCDSTARNLGSKSALLGKALKDNSGGAPAPAPAAMETLPPPPQGRQSEGEPIAGERASPAAAGGSPPPTTTPDRLPQFPAPPAAEAGGPPQG